MPKWVGLGVAAQFLIMPVVGWSVAMLFSLPDQFKLGIILVSCCPGGDRVECRDIFGEGEPGAQRDDDDVFDAAGDRTDTVFDEGLCVGSF